MSDYFEQVERQLRDAIRRGASRPGWGHALEGDGSSASGRMARRLRRSNHHPEGRYLGGAWARIALGVGCAAAAGAIVLAIVGLGPGAQRAFAGWTASPTAAPGTSDDSITEGECLAQLRNGAEGTSRIYQSATGWHVAITDTRGPFNLLVLESSDGTARVTCLTGDSSPAHFIQAGGGLTPEPAPSAGRIVKSSFYQMVVTSPRGQEAPSSEIYGFAGPDVRGVTLDLSNGTDVVATVANGRFLAWWPSSARPATAEIATANGTNTEQLNPQ